METIWQAGVKAPDFPTPRGDIKTDVLVIGGGIAGILTAYFLQQKGIDYILVEKDKICSGTTKGTTAKITFQHGLFCNKISKSNGIETANVYLKANQWAFDEFISLCENIDCDLERKDNFVYSLDNRQALEDEVKALQRIGFDAKLCDGIPLPMNTKGAVMFPDQAQFHPLKFLYAIAEKLNIYEHCFIRELEGTSAVYDNGKIHAKTIVAATHFPFINKHGSYFVKLYQHRTYMTALLGAQDVGGMYVDESKKGLTFRNYGEYLLLGGGGHRTGKSGGNWEELRSFAETHYPKAEEKFYWAEQDCMSLDSMPYIGRYSKSTHNFYTASGFNKWGMTGAMLSAMILSDMLAGNSNEFAKFFSPSRYIMKPQLLANGLDAMKNLITISEKRCPHLGCALKWNDAEHSWDCSCHGSRFSESGKVLDNPANGDLKEE